ncbi:extracellular solute-binding protein [Paenibacillus dendritiformis]|uniref:extracellular solute-binding protein n=1 Tax=Paenibacillus dendritiformis TaxID=130049 RepID=UPI000DA94ADB|nr:extracellular solute-binding protein [Paenibacillus dendritiformis]PZM66544.1 ABC transporter substrate-binding protein [Paenibacillus dendritiformis]
MKRSVWICLALSLALVLSACSGGGSSGGAPAKNYEKVSDMKGTVRIALAGWQMENGVDTLTGRKTVGFNPFIQDTFKKMYPNIELKVTQIPWENALAKQKAMLLSNDVDLLYTGGAYANQFYQQGLLRDIDDLIAGDSSFDPGIYLEGVFKNSYSVRSLDGMKQFGIPVILGKRMVVYDKQIFEDWGVEPLSANPTPEEILEKAKKMTGMNPKTGKQNYGLWFSGNSLNQSTFVSLSYAYDVNGVEGRLDKLRDLTWNLNSPEMAKVMEWFKEAAPLAPKAFINGQGAENFGLEDNNIAIAIDSSGGAAFNEYRSSGKAELVDRFVPVLNMGPNGEGWVAVDPFVMAKNVQDEKAAWEVMKFLTSYDMQRHLYENGLATPTLKKADFVDEKDVYTSKAMELADIARKNLIDEANPFYNTRMVPVINGFISQAANGNPTDIGKLLSDLQAEAVKWSAEQ